MVNFMQACSHEAELQCLLATGSVIESYMPSVLRERQLCWIVSLVAYITKIEIGIEDDSR